MLCTNTRLFVKSILEPGTQRQAPKCPGVKVLGVQGWMGTDPWQGSGKGKSGCAQCSRGRAGLASKCGLQSHGSQKGGLGT